MVTGDQTGQHDLQGGGSEDPLAAIAAASTGQENLTVSDDAVAVDGEAVTEAAGRLLTRGTAAGDPKRVRRAVELSESVLAAARAGTASYVGAAANAARALTAEYEMTGRGGALDRAVAFCRWRAADIRSILAAGPGIPRPRTAGDALILDLPAVPVRPLADYAISGLS